MQKLLNDSILYAEYSHLEQSDDVGGVRGANGRVRGRGHLQSRINAMICARAAELERYFKVLRLA